jgi:GT2 family glycosyltransferase
MPEQFPVSVVVLTHNRARELQRTLWRLTQLPEKPLVVVVDNGSQDGTSERVRELFPQMRLVRCEHNLGAAGRNAGVAEVETPYVAFCDDDCWWAPGSLRRAAQLLDAHPDVAALAARVLVGPEEREDPTCSAMAHSPLEAVGLPGPALIGFMAGAVVMRTEAFRAVGGYEPRLFIGGEERLMGLDLATRGWRMAYVPELVVHHHPSTLRDAGGRRSLILRNELWIAWLRLPWRSVWRETGRALRAMAQAGRVPDALWSALRGLPWALVHRRVVPQSVEAMRQRVLESPPHGGGSRVTVRA